MDGSGQQGDSKTVYMNKPTSACSPDFAIVSTTQFFKKRPIPFIEVNTTVLPKDKQWRQ